MADTSLTLQTSLELITLIAQAIPLQVNAGAMDKMAGHTAGQRCNDLRKAISSYPRRIAQERQIIWRETLWLLDFMSRYAAKLEANQRKQLMDTELRFRILIS